MNRIALFMLAALSTPGAAFAQTAAAPAPAPSPSATATGASPATAAPAAGAPTPAPGKPTLSAGATVLGSDGTSIGKIESNDGTNSVLDTGTMKVTLANSSFGNSANGPTIAMTKTQLDAAASAKAGENAAALQAKLTPGAQVYGKGGTMVGTIKAADAQFVTLTTPKGDVRIPVNGFGSNEKGVMLNMTDAELSAAMTPAKK